MPKRCCVPNCKSNSSNKTDYVTCFGIPKDAKMREIWKKKIPRDFEFTKYTTVCEKHFYKKDVIRIDNLVRKDGTVLSVPRVIPKLASDAYPCFFPAPNPPQKNNRLQGNYGRLCSCEFEDEKKVRIPTISKRKKCEKKVRIPTKAKRKKCEKKVRIPTKAKTKKKVIKRQTCRKRASKTKQLDIPKDLQVVECAKTNLKEHLLFLAETYIGEEDSANAISLINRGLELPVDTDNDVTPHIKLKDFKDQYNIFGTFNAL